MAHACNPANWRLRSLNGLKAGFLGAGVLCRSGVRAKFGVNIGNTEESELSRLVKKKSTQQAKTPASKNSWTAPVNRRSFAARSIKSNLAFSLLSERIETELWRTSCCSIAFVIYDCTYIF